MDELRNLELGGETLGASRAGGKEGAKMSHVRYDPKAFLSGVFSKENRT